MLANNKKYRLISEDIFGEKIGMTDDGALVKVLIYDIVRHFRIVSVISLVVSSNCYDRIAHAIKGVACEAMLEYI